MNRYLKSLIDECIAALFKSEDDRYTEQIDGLIAENEKHFGKITRGFNYLGKNYGRYGQTVAYGSALASHLIPKMSELSNDRKQVELDRQIITQVFYKLARDLDAKDHRDIRDLFPDCLVKLHPYLSGIARTREPTWFGRGNPRGLEQYEKILVKIQYYIALRLLY